MTTKLTLPETWKRCLRMWRWVVKEWKKDKDISIETLKGLWLAKHDPDANLAADCYFCDYVGDDFYGFCGSCDDCPGVLVDRMFHCCNSAYDYEHKPNKFLAKLKQLNKKRLGKSKK